MIYPFNSYLPDFRCFLVGDELELLCVPLLECLWERLRCRLPLLDLLYLSGVLTLLDLLLLPGVLQLSVLLESLPFSSFLSIISGLLKNFKFNTPCRSLTFMRFRLSARQAWASLCNPSMIFIMCPSLSFSFPCPLEFDPSTSTLTSFPSRSSPGLEAIFTFSHSILDVG